MSEPYDVFISYARGDAARVEIVREKLEALGLSVFFDAEGIDSGEEFPVVIDRAVKTAKCVLGLWSRAAFSGRWVRIESRIGLDQNKLVAAVIDNMRPEDLPAEFYNVNIENLSDFHGQPDHEGWARVLRAIGRRVGRSDLAGTRPPRARARHASAPARGPGNAIWLIGGGAAAALVVFVALQMIQPSRSVERAPPATSVEEYGRDESASLRTSDDAAAREKAALEEEAARREAARERLEAARVWDDCDGGRLAACRAYVERYPNGEFVRLASSKIDELTAPPPPVAADLSGTWAGYYVQDNNRTPFTVQISGRSGRFQGRMAERNTFADRSFPQLFANIAGETRADGAVAFVKTYDGTAGVSHSVNYAGRIDDSGRIITGVWRIDALSGEFRMQRQ